MDINDNTMMIITGFEVPTTTAHRHALCYSSDPATPSSLPESPLSILKHEMALPKLRIRTSSVSVGRGASMMEVVGHQRCHSYSVTVPRNVPQLAHRIDSPTHAKSTPAINIPSSHGSSHRSPLWQTACHGDSACELSFLPMGLKGEMGNYIDSAAAYCHEVTPHTAAEAPPEIDTLFFLELGNTERCC